MIYKLIGKGEYIHRTYASWEAHLVLSINWHFTSIHMIWYEELIWCYTVCAELWGRMSNIRSSHGIISALSKSHASVSSFHCYLKLGYHLQTVPVMTSATGSMPSKSSFPEFTLLVCLSVWFCCAGDPTQVLTHLRQTLCYWATASFLVSYSIQGWPPLSPEDLSEPVLKVTCSLLPKLFIPSFISSETMQMFADLHK